MFVACLTALFAPEPRAGHPCQRPQLWLLLVMTCGQVTSRYYASADNRRITLQQRTRSTAGAGGSQELLVACRRVQPQHTRGSFVSITHSCTVALRLRACGAEIPVPPACASVNTYAVIISVSRASRWTRHKPANGMAPALAATGMAPALAAMLASQCPSGAADSRPVAHTMAVTSSAQRTRLCFCNETVSALLLTTRNATCGCPRSVCSSCKPRHASHRPMPLFARCSPLERPCSR
jgi:hypothetical protein